ncbi:MAG: hypothetical protein WCR29_02685 [Bacteroidales bacterium]|nr:hypothetical protein [Bacteroidales bacterium]
MNNIIDLQKQADELSTKICSFCKPLILSPLYKEQVRQLLSSETDLRLSIEYSMEAETKEEALEKISLAKQEAEIILYILIQLNKEKPNEVVKIIEIAKIIISTIEEIK